MSKHPLGPWTEDIPGAPVTYDNYCSAFEITNAVDMSVTGTGGFFSSHRTGTNNGYGKGYYPPSPASCLIKAAEWERGVNWSAKQIKQGGVVYLYTGSGFPNWTLAPDFVTNPDALNSVRNAAFQKLYKKVSRTVMEGGVFTGELKESKETVKAGFELIHSRAQSATKFLGRVYKNTRAGHFSLAAKELADVFLEFRFGVSPIINDIGKATEAFYQSSVNTSLLRHVHGTYVQNFSGHTESPFQTSLISANTVMCKDKVTSLQILLVKVGGTMDLRVPLADVNPDYTRFGVGWDRLGPTVYELLPYTWLLDYCVNVQDFINCLAFRRGVVRDGWKVEIIKTVHTHRFEPYVRYPSSTFFLTSGGTGILKERVFSFNRSPYAVDTFVPEMVMKIPDISQTANIAALAVSRLAGIKSRAVKRQTHELDKRQMRELTMLANEQIIR